MLAIRIGAALAGAVLAFSSLAQPALKMMIPANPGKPTTLSEARSGVKELADTLAGNEGYRRLFDLAAPEVKVAGVALEWEGAVVHLTAGEVRRRQRRRR